MKVQRHAALAIAVALTIAACGAAQESPEGTDTTSIGTQVPGNGTTPPAGGATGDPETGQDAAAVDIAPELLFTATDIVSGEQFSGADLAGTNTVLWFWAPWCTTCQFESVVIRQYIEQLPDDIEIIGVAGIGEQSEYLAFIDDYGLEGMRHIEDATGDIWSGFGVAATSSYGFVNADGAIEVLQGVVPSIEVDARIEAMSGS